jgi:hypothetical protein
MAPLYLWQCAVAWLPDRARNTFGRKRRAGFDGDYSAASSASAGLPAHDDEIALAALSALQP